MPVPELPTDVTRPEPSSAVTPTHIFYILDDTAGCAWYRCRVPGMELMRLGYGVRFNGHMTPQDVEWADVIVFQRQWSTPALQVMQMAKSLGKRIVYELDDDIWSIQPWQPNYSYWQDPKIVGPTEQMLRDADVITTTTEPLASQLRRFNQKVRVLPNMIPPEMWQIDESESEATDPISIGWAGSASRGTDLGLVRTVVAQLLDRYPDLRFVLGGDKSNMVFGDDPRVVQLEPVTLGQYPKLLSNIDIGLAPLQDNRFNQAKSDLKFLEYGMLGIPTVASHVTPYSSSIVNGENGFLAKNDKDWLKYLRRLIEDAELRRMMGENAKRFAEARTIDKNVHLWEKAYGLR